MLSCRQLACRRNGRAAQPAVRGSISWNGGSARSHGTASAGLKIAARSASRADAGLANRNSPFSSSASLRRTPTRADHRRRTVPGVSLFGLQTGGAAWSRKRTYMGGSPPGFHEGWKVHQGVAAHRRWPIINWVWANRVSLLLLIRLFQQATRYSVGGWPVRSFLRTCASFSVSSRPRRPASSIWPRVAGRRVSAVRAADTSEPTRCGNTVAGDVSHAGTKSP
jgi:hypothetical protein